VSASEQRRRERTRAGLVLVAWICGVRAWAQLPPEPAGIEQLPTRPGVHWVWVNDMAFFSLPDGKAYLVDGDSGKMLGMLSTGYSFNALIVPRSGDVIYSPETYYSRGTRGTRTDVVTFYDASRLTPLGEVAIPPKRSSNIPMLANAALTDDERFLLIYNFTPAQSVTVVDLRTRKLVGEIDTPGCALVYPTGARTFFSICSDGALLLTTLTNGGRAAARVHTAALFDSIKDPLTEKGVRAGDTWLFASLEGTIYPLRSTRGGIELGATWPLFTPEELAARWRTGGLQHLALHAASGRLYAIVHQGGPETHKDPGTALWVYDVALRRRVQQIALHDKTGSIQVSQDARPLLFGCFIESSTLDIYDAMSGKYLRSVAGIGQTPSVLVNP
jgi:methylamine dehydrogenase heavy chain